MDIVSSAEARKLGLTHYFTGVPCKYSHISVRQVSNRGCCQCLHERAIGWAKDNPVRAKEILTKWNEENREREALRARVWRANNPDTYKRGVKAWRDKNMLTYRAYMAKMAMDRSVAKQHRTPAWLTEDAHWLMSQAYELAALRSEMFGFSWHVDHIVPLRGKRVSGLHVPWNLQVIPGTENRAKSNKFT